MASKGIYQFATRDDYEPLLRAIELKRPVKYVVYGMFDSPILTTYYSGSDIPSLGTATVGNSGSETFYMVVDLTTDVALREVPQCNGTMRYGVELSPNAITFWPGGLLIPTDAPLSRLFGVPDRFHKQYVIRGEVGTASDDASSISLYRLFANEIRRRFTRVRSFWVGSSALNLMNSGTCLTDDIRSPDEFCLKR